MIRAFEYSNRIDYWVGVSEEAKEVSASPLLRVVKPGYGYDATEEEELLHKAQVVVLKRGLAALGEYLPPNVVEDFAVALGQAAADARRLDAGQRNLYPRLP